MASGGGGGGGNGGSGPASASNASSVSLASALRGGGGGGRGRGFLYEGLLGRERSRLWDNMQFWEDLFLDWVSNEREVLGLDCGSADRRRRRQELYEDRLLGRALHNTAALMLTMGVERLELQRKIRRLLARSHVGLHHSRKIGRLLDGLPPSDPADAAAPPGNAVRLRAPLSRLPRRPAFDARLARGCGGDGDAANARLGELRYLEVSDHCLALRCRSGGTLRRVWFDSLASVAYAAGSRRLELREPAAAGGGVAAPPLLLRCRRGRRVCRCIRDRVARRAAAEDSPSGVIGCRLRVDNDCVVLQLQSERMTLSTDNSPVD